MKTRLATLSVVLFFVSLTVSPMNDSAVNVDDVARQLICQCGCTMVLNNCSHAECVSRETMLGIIRQKISQGQSEEQIILAFVNQYGEQVLAEPPKKGFNLTAWLAPFAGLALGAGIIYFALKHWLKRGRRSEANAAVIPEEEDEKYQQRLERELKEFPERGFR